MIKLFVTGDVHLGKKYDRYPEIRDRLIRSRFECLKNCVEEAERQGCDIFVVTGDLFDNVSSIKLQDVKQAAGILSAFGGRVLVLPGNHDYYTGEEKVWRDFLSELNLTDNNVMLITEMRPLTIEVRDESISFYPAFCQKKHSATNNLGWIKACGMDDSDFHVGLAHGSLSGLSPDMKNEYFLMTEAELNAIPVDAWLLGHTHIPYPAGLVSEGFAHGYRIFNPGTPEQTDLSNNTDGCCFIVTLEKAGGRADVGAKSFISGKIRYFDLEAEADGTCEGASLEAAVSAAVSGLPSDSVVRLTVSGTAGEADYLARNDIFSRHLGRFLSFETDDSGLSELITPERIRSEFAEIGFASAFLESLDDPREVQMAYELINKYRA